MDSSTGCHTKQKGPCDCAHEAHLTAYATYIIKLGTRIDHAERQQSMEQRDDAHVAAREAVQTAIILLEAELEDEKIKPTKDIESSDKGKSTELPSKPLAILNPSNMGD